jgi:LacI family transcriptional regulator
MNITIKDVAKIANVSYATVSRALNGHNDVSEKTKRRVIDICEQIGYSPNAIARGLVKNSTDTIGLLIPDITNPFFSDVAWGVEDEASKKGYNVILCNTNWELSREESYFKLLCEKRVGGIIVAPVSDETISLVERFGIKLPVVFVGSNPKDESFNFVVADNLKAGFMATEYLIKLGHLRIALIGGNEYTSTYRDRFEGYRMALDKYGLIYDANFVKSGSFRRDSGYRLTKGLVEIGNTPSAVVAANDMVALGVIEAIEELNMNIPDDISLIGFDDISYASLPKIKLTTISQPKYNIGKKSVDILFKRIDGRGLRKGTYEILQPELIERSTCKSILDF